MLKSNFLKKLGLCALSAALCASAFASCGKDDGGDGDDGKKIDENTNISDVVSEKVADETAWKAAFDLTKFTNFSMKTASKRTVAAKTTQDALTYLYTGDKAYYSDVETSAEGKTNRDDVYLSKSGDDFVVYGISYENGEKVYEGAYDKNNSGEYEYMMTGKTGTAQLSQIGAVSFSDVSYSEEKKGYIYSKDGSEAVLKIADGLFAGYAMSGKSGEGESEMSTEMSAIYYNIGTTEITLPEKMNKPEDDAGASSEITAEVFFTELKKREDASIEAKKWGTVNVSGTIVKDGVTVNVNQNNLAILHDNSIGSVNVPFEENAKLSFAIFRYSTRKDGIPDSVTQKYEKDGANLKSTWTMTINSQTQTVKITYDADGYVIDYDYNDGFSVRKLTFSGYAGEYKLSDDSGKQPGGDDKKAELTKDTNFTTLESEKVTAEGWEQAFSNSNEAYKNFTAIAYTKIGVNVYYVQKRTEKSGFYGVASKTDFVTDPKEDTYVYENENGEYMERTTSGDEAYGRLRDGMPIPMLYSCFCPDFSEYFSLFTYDETSNAYVYEGDGIEANSYLWYGVGTKKYVKAELKIVNGALACVNTVDEDGRSTKTSFFDFGTTEVELPEIEK